MQTTHEEPEEKPAEPDVEEKTNEVGNDSSFFNHDETVIPAEADELEEKPEDIPGEENEDILAGLLESGMPVHSGNASQNSSSQGKILRPKKVNLKWFKMKGLFNDFPWNKFIC